MIIICNKCNLEKENTEYYKNRRICKTCIIDKQKEISKNDYDYNKLKDSIKEYGKNYYHNIYKIKKMNNNIYNEFGE